MKKAQNLIEFVYIFPLVVFLGLAIFELALFWKSVNYVNMINEEITANAVLFIFASAKKSSRSVDFLK